MFSENFHHSDKCLNKTLNFDDITCVYPCTCARIYVKCNSAIVSKNNFDQNKITCPMYYDEEDWILKLSPLNAQRDA